MADLATLRNQLEELRAAYRSGATSIGYGDKRIEYRDTAGMQAAIAALEAEIAAITGSKPPRLIVARSTKGY
ncbi:phage head-tail joining protein [Bradyrhizobium cenepequi]